MVVLETQTKMKFSVLLLSLFILIKLITQRRRGGQRLGGEGGGIEINPKSNKAEQSLKVSKLIYGRKP